MPVLQQQESRTPVDERVRRHLEEKLNPAVVRKLQCCSVRRHQPPQFLEPASKVITHAGDSTT